MCPDTNTFYLYFTSIPIEQRKSITSEFTVLNDSLGAKSYLELACKAVPEKIERAYTLFGVHRLHRRSTDGKLVLNMLT